MSRSITCRISNKSYTYAADYYDKIVSEYTDVETLRKYFVTRKVKQLIARGYSVIEIRNILNVVDENIVKADSQEIADIMVYHGVRNDTNAVRVSSNFATHKSDHDVSVFINNIRDLNYDKEIHCANRK